MIPIVLTVRKESERCSNKILRPFTESGLSLLDVCLEKFKNNLQVYVAGCDSEFKQMATKYNVNFIQRTRKSSLAETPEEIHAHLLDVNFGLVCHVNVCCPMLKIETIYKAITKMESTKIISLFSVKESHEIMFDHEQKLVNSDSIFNSKEREACYIGNNAVTIFDVSKFFKTGQYWTYKLNDPYLFMMSEEESIDIDTELDFQIAQHLYQLVNRKKGK